MTFPPITFEQLLPAAKFVFVWQSRIERRSQSYCSAFLSKWICASVKPLYYPAVSGGSQRPASGGIRQDPRVASRRRGQRLTTATRIVEAKHLWWGNMIYIYIYFLYLSLCPLSLCLIPYHSCTSSDPSVLQGKKKVSFFAEVEPSVDSLMTDYQISIGTLSILII